MSFNDLLNGRRGTVNKGSDKKKSKGYRNLCLEGGGILGIAHCGALEELHKRGLLASIKNFAGSSAGSIIAGALACGASFNFLMKELGEANFASFLDYGNRCKAVWNLYYYNGAAPGDVFMEWYGSVVEKLTGDRDITLGRVHDKYGGRLVITGTSLNRRKSVYFDYRSHPNLSLRLAVRISMSIPGIFIPVQHDGDVFVDGGVLDNFPINAFHKETRDSDRINPKTLGLMLMTTMDAADRYPPVSGFTSFIASLYGCYMTQTQKTFMDPQDWARTVKIPCGEVSSFDFYISEDVKQALIEAGRKAVRDFFGATQISQGDYLTKTEPIDTGYRPEDDATPQGTPVEVNTPSIVPAITPTIASAITPVHSTYPPTDTKKSGLDI